MSVMRARILHEVIIFKPQKCLSLFHQKKDIGNEAMVLFFSATNRNSPTREGQRAFMTAEKIMNRSDAAHNW